MEIKEISELQAVDFGLGSHIAAAFTGFSDVGSVAWHEFLKRPVNRKIYRHETDGPQGFMKALQSSQKAEKTATSGERSNAVELPVAFYFRKPGMTNSENNYVIGGKVVWTEAMAKSLNVMLMPVALDYQLFLLSWDKPTLDKMQLAYYAWITRHDKFVTKYKIADEVLDVNAYVIDHRTVTWSDVSQPLDGGRLFAVMMPISINTQVLAGAEVVIPESVTVDLTLEGYLK